MIIPPYLKKGDTIGITCPAGYMPLKKAATCIDTLQKWGYEVLVGKTLGSSSRNYFSGTDEDRLQELQAMLDAPSIQAILCGRGGYGLGRIIDKLDFKKFKKHPKWIIGFSDITVMHAHLNRNYNIASLHAPMASAFDTAGIRSAAIRSLKEALEGKKSNYTCKAHPLNKTGTATGALVGGNLALVTNMIGTPSDLKTKNKILFLEDVGEQLYNIDRMLRQLQRSGKLDHLAGLLLGGFTETKDTERVFGQTAYELIHEIIGKAPYPVCFGFPVSHGKENLALKSGINHRLHITPKGCTLQES